MLDVREIYARHVDCGEALAAIARRHEVPYPAVRKTFHAMAAHYREHGWPDRPIPLTIE